MKLYILPDQVETFKKKVALASKHLKSAPAVSFSEVQSVKEETITEINNGWDGRSRSVRIINVVEVTIEDIKEGEWVLVATVCHGEGLVTLVSEKYFKSIPAHLGLGYKKCDYCGHTHKSRLVSHIVHNTVTGEWKQIGSTCVTKMFGSDYLDSFSTKLFHFIEIKLCSSDPMSFFSGGWALPSHYFSEALLVDSVIPAVVSYRKERATEWQKKQYDDRGRVIAPGTTTMLNDYYDDTDCKPNKAYISRVRTFVKGLCEKDDFNCRIKEVFESDYVARYDIYTVFFAVKMYEDSLSEPEWAEYSGRIKEEGSIVLRNAKIENVERYEDYFGTSYVFTLTDEQGHTFVKSSGSVTVFDSFKSEDGTVTAVSPVKYINNKKRQIELGGRLRAYKA